MVVLLDTCIPTYHNEAYEALLTFWGDLPGLKEFYANRCNRLKKVLERLKTAGNAI